jgi:hypothetical protein
MSRIITFIGLLSLYCLLATPIAAQETATPSPDYRIDGRVEYTGETGATIYYTVHNDGAPASQVTIVELTSINGAQLAQSPLRALASNDQEDGSIPFPIEQFPSDWYPPGITVNVLLIVDSDNRVETDPTTRDNNFSRAIEVRIPESAPVTSPQPATIVPTTTPTSTPVAEEDETFLESLQREIDDFFNIDTSDPTNALIAVGILASGTIVFLLFWVLFRVLFRRPPSFGNWQPPYATMPPLDPNSTYGRRQAWQQHASHNTVPIPCQPGQVKARKVLLGTDGRYLSGWSILAARLTQFDMYGRVSRSQVLGSKRSIKRMNGLAKNTGKFDERKLAKKVRPVAKSLSKQFRKKMSRRSAMLPSALDLRLRGTHGEVRILFELYDCRHNQPFLLDRWEPEMMVMSKMIYESYTCTIQGQRGGESYKDFRRRLPKDLEQILVDMFRVVMVAPEPTAPPTSPQDPPQTPLPPESTPGVPDTPMSVRTATLPEDLLPEGDETIPSQSSENDED